MSHSLGLVLSGGGMRGIAHVGLLQALEEYNIRPTIIAGTSAGAIVGALYAAGCSTGEMLRFWDQSNPFQFSYFALAKPGFIDSEKFHEIFSKFLSEETFEALPTRLLTTATDIANAKLKVFNSGPLTPAILASAAFPGVFSPVSIDGIIYADGGIANNFPVELIRDECKFILGSYVNPVRKLESHELDSTLEVSLRAFELSLNFDSTFKFHKCDWLIRPEALSAFGTFEMGRIEEIFEIGYFEALKHIDAIRAKLEEE